VLYSSQYVLELDATLTVQNINDLAPDALHLKPTSERPAEQDALVVPPQSEVEAEEPNPEALLATDDQAVNPQICVDIDCGEELVCQPDALFVAYTCVPWHTQTSAEGVWRLVRRTAGPLWHSATDDVAGTAVYGRYDTSTSTSTFSVPFSPGDYDEFKFATGDDSRYVIVSTGTVTGLPESINPTEASVKSSHLSSDAVNVNWYNRGTTYPEDPMISFSDYSDENRGTVLYAENSLSSDPYGRIDLYNGANVWVRKLN